MLGFISLGRLCHEIGLDSPPDSFSYNYNKKFIVHWSKYVRPNLKKTEWSLIYLVEVMEKNPIQIPIKCDGTYQKRIRFIALK